MGRLEAFALANKPWPSFLDAVGNAMGYAAGGQVTAGGGGTTSLSATTNVALPDSLNFLRARLQDEIEDTVIKVLKEELNY